MPIQCVVDLPQQAQGLQVEAVVYLSESDSICLKPDTTLSNSGQGSMGKTVSDKHSLFSVQDSVGPYKRLTKCEVTFL